MRKPDYEKHGGDKKWWIESGYAIQRNDWIPITECLPPENAVCWFTVEIEGGQRYAEKDRISAYMIEQGVKHNHPCIVAWMPFEADPEPYGGE